MNRLLSRGSIALLLAAGLPVAVDQAHAAAPPGGQPVEIGAQGVGALDAEDEHRAAGGLVIAATHQALGLEDARNLHIAQAAPRAPEPADDAEEAWA